VPHHAGCICLQPLTSGTCNYTSVLGLELTRSVVIGPQQLQQPCKLLCIERMRLQEVRTTAQFSTPCSTIAAVAGLQGPCVHVSQVTTTRTGESPGTLPCQPPDTMHAVHSTASSVQQHYSGRCYK
jgi:hypothetical protein